MTARLHATLLHYMDFNALMEILLFSYKIYGKTSQFLLTFCTKTKDVLIYITPEFLQGDSIELRHGV